MDIWEIDKAFLFIVLVLPGFISIKVYDLIVAGDKRDFSKSILDSVAYSVLNFAALSWLIILISSDSFSAEHEFAYLGSIFLIFIVCPVIWPFLFVWVSGFSILRKHLLSPINQPWDMVFSEKKGYWIIVYLKTGEVVRGKYALKSSASAYPKERQLYIEEVWKAGKNGGFEKKVNRTKGVLLFESEISKVEFYE